MSDMTVSQLQLANEQLRLELAKMRGLLDEAEGDLAASHQRAADIARQVERGQDAFLSKLAHDLRNPLAPVRNSLEILKLLDRGDAEGQRAIEIIDGQVRSMARLLDEVLDLSRIICEKIDLKKQPVALAEVVALAVERNDSLMNRYKHRLDVSLPSEPIWIMGNAARLTQAFSNLLENAAKYTAEGGQIRLTAVADGGDVVCRIVDNGSGMDAETLPRVFDLFAHAERSLEAARPGRGVGLTIVRKLVAMHGGRVEALSEGLGRGSEFIMRLPRLLEQDLSNAAPAGAIAGLENLPARRILVVSSEDFAEEIAMLLRLAGHDTRTARTAPDAIQLALDFRPEVIVIELDLPGVDANDLGRRLRFESGLEKSFLIAITGMNNDKNRQRAAAASCQAHLAKPLRIRDLLRLMADHDALAGSRSAIDPVS